MLVQVLAMWLIVGVTLVAFMASEKRRRDSAIRVRARRNPQRKD